MTPETFCHIVRDQYGLSFPQIIGGSVTIQTPGSSLSVVVGSVEELSRMTEKQVEARLERILGGTDGDT